MYLSEIHIFIDPFETKAPLEKKSANLFTIHINWMSDPMAYIR